MEYTILISSFGKGLEKEVKRFINNGWKPIGGVSAAYNFANELLLCQAMIKDGE